MPSTSRKRSRLLIGFFATTLCHNTFNTYTYSLAEHQLVDNNNGSQLGDIHNKNNIKSMEIVANTVRNSFININNKPITHNKDYHIAKKNKLKVKQRQRRKQQQQHLNHRNLIVGGQAAPPGRFPYVVSLQLEKILDESASTNNGGAEVSDVHTCGGTLIANDVVLTAGHCGYEELQPITNDQIGSVNTDGAINFGEAPKQIFFGADVGAYNLSSSVNGGYAVDNMLFEKLILHPEYTGFHGKGGAEKSLQHDVMLVKLYGSSDQPVVRLHDPSISNEYIEHGKPRNGEEFVVTGWGDTDPISGKDNAKLSSILHAAAVSYVPNDGCEESKGFSNVQGSIPGQFQSGSYFEYEGTISDDMMCALGKSNQDACQGDSGGGLLRLGDDYSGGKDVQMGIVSWGLQCGDEDFPGVYSRVGTHFDWIRDQVCELSDSPPSYFNCPAKPYPPGSPYDPIVDLTVTLRFDDYRSETAWLLESIPDFRNVVFRPFGTYKDKLSVDENHAMSEIVTVHSNRWYMLSILDEFADGFCCTAGEGFFRVESPVHEQPLVDTTPGILWSPYALRRAFYVSPPDDTPDYVTIVVTLGAGADPGKFLLLAVENVEYEALMTYEIRPFSLMADPRSNDQIGGIKTYSREFKVPVFGTEFNRQRYNVMVYDDNKPDWQSPYVTKAKFEVYLGDPVPENLIVSQSGNYGDKNNISRSFVLFKKPKDDIPSDSIGVISTASDMKSMATSRRDITIIHSFLCLMFVASFFSI